MSRSRLAHRGLAAAVALSLLGLPVPPLTAAAGSTADLPCMIQENGVGYQMPAPGSCTVERPVAARPIEVVSYRPGSVEEWRRKAITNTTGTMSTSFRIPSNRQIWMRPDPIGCYLHGEEVGQTALVRILVRKRITRTVSDWTPAVGQTVRIAGVVYPSAASQPVNLQRWNGSRFVNIAASRTSSASGGKYAFSYRPTNRGSHALRVYTPYDWWHVSSGSPNAYLSVHDVGEPELDLALGGLR